MTIGLRLRTAAATALPTGVKRRLKRLLRAYRQRVSSFTPDDLRQALHQLGIAPGDVLMVHSAFDAFLGFQGGPVDVVRVLQELVGTQGTLLMPTIPFRGTAVEYAQADPIFDARRTPSQMGLISEIFRRFPDVVRSHHPTHSVAAWGHRALETIAGHEQCPTPCGRLTPYGKLLDYDGKVLLAGADPAAITFRYFVAEELAPRVAVRVLLPETHALRWRDDAGAIQTSHIHLFAPGLDHDAGRLVAELKRRRLWRERRIGGFARFGRFGGLRLILLRARDIYDAAVALAERRQFLHA